jgi:hypothetical protein
MSSGARRIRVFALMAAVLVAVFVTIAVLREEPPEPSGTPARTGDPAMDVVPERVGDLPRIGARVPSPIDPAGPAPPLAGRRPYSAAALLQQYRDTGDAPVLVLGTDGTMRTLDLITFTRTGDADGNQRPVVSGAALTADGTRAAFPQRDRVVVVDLAAGSAYDLPVAGFNEAVRWWGGQLLVSQADAVLVVGPLGSDITPAPYPFADLVAPSTEVELTGLLPADGTRPATVRRWPAGGPVDRPITGAGADARWSGDGWAAGNRLARAARLPGEAGFGRVFVVDATTGATVRSLRVPCASPQPSDACASVAGWSPEGMVLVEVRGSSRWLLAWDAGAGRQFQVTEVLGGPVAAVWSAGLTRPR